ncbi:MAG TPA: DUF3034 family protein [Sedimentisphaerales bacterium]|nr:DUF3034 family protein [Sedimentisphaerales bacterium]
MNARTILTVHLIPVVCTITAWAGPPLPLHTVEGNSGVFITSTAYLANPPEEGRKFGVPSISASVAFMEKKDFESFAVTENLWGRVELGYAIERLGIDDWSDDVFDVTAGTRVEDTVWLHNFNARWMAIQEGAGERPWVPAVTLGAHFKANDGVSDIDDQLGGLCETLGVDSDTGVEFTVVATKAITNVLKRPIIVSAGLRNGGAIHTGLCGFSDSRKTTFEGSVIVFLSDNLAFATEYRQKPDLMDEFSAGGVDLVTGESDWWDLALAYVVNDHLTISGGYANFGKVLNNQEDSVIALQVKYEF